MTKLTTQMLAEEAPKRWARQYGICAQMDKTEITDTLEALTTITPDIINKVIGNSTWTQTRCDECNTKNIDVMQLGETPNYESNTAFICKECLIKALKEL